MSEVTLPVELSIDGTPTAFEDVSKVLTSTLDSSARWIPEHITSVGSLRVTENGEYEPYGHYGYWKVDVEVSGGDDCDVHEVSEDGKVTVRHVTVGDAKVGKYGGGSLLGRGEDGNMEYVRVNENGEIERYKVPSKARFLVPPVTRYHKGDTPDFSGASIELLYEDGTVASEWRGGVLYEGTATWANVVEVPTELEDRYGTQELTAMIVPFWYHGGDQMGAEYGLACSVQVVVEEGV